MQVGRLLGGVGVVAVRWEKAGGGRNVAGMTWRPFRVPGHTGYMRRGGLYAGHRTLEKVLHRSTPPVSW